jgi:predicted aspartyl protease
LRKPVFGWAGWRPWLAGLALFLLAGCAGSVQNCKLVEVAQMPLTVEKRLLIVPAGVNGHWVRLVVDTGAERTVLSEETAVRLGLPRDPRFVSHTVGVGGMTTSTDVALASLVLGGVRFPVSHVAVNRLPLDGTAGLRADGLLGADILLAFDLDIDVPGQRLTLYRSRLCADSRPPWPEQAIPVAGIAGRKDRLLLPIELDGVGGMAVLDTGAQSTTIGVGLARKLGLDAQAMAQDPTVRHIGAGPGSMVAHIHRFDELRIGPAIVRNVQLSVLPVDAGVGDALVGEDFLHDRRVWLSFPGRQMFVSLLPHEQAANARAR